MIELATKSKPHISNSSDQTLDRAVGWLRLLRGELARSPGRLAVYFALPLTVFLTWSARATGIYFWTDAARSLESATLITGPFWVGVMAWAGHQDSHSGAALTRRLSVRDTSPHAIAAVAGGAAYALWSQLLTTFVAVTFYLANSSTGSFPLVQLIRPMFSLVFACAVGYGMGRALRTRVAVPFAALAYYAVFAVLSLRESPVRLLVPSYEQLTIAFLDWKPGLLGRHLVLLIAATAAALALAALLNSRRPLNIFFVASAMAATIWSGSAVMANGSGFLDTSQPAVFEFDCQGSAPEICLHPAYSDGHDDVAATVKPYAERLMGTPGEIRRLEHQARGVGDGPSVGALALYLDDLTPFQIHDIVPEQVTYLIDWDSCADDSDSRLAASQISDLVSAYLITGSFPQTESAQLQPISDWLSELSPKDLTAWLNANWVGYTECTLTPSNFQ